MGWTVHRGSGRLLVFTNQNGEAVSDVKMTLRGKAVGGMFPRRDWTVTRAEMTPGAAVEAPFKAAFGARTDPPRMEIEWTSADGQRRQVVLDDLPL